MVKSIPFDEHVTEYDEWFVRYPLVFQSEVEAIREMLPVGDSLFGIEVALGTGRFARELGIKEGVEPSPNMRAMALKRGIEARAGEAEHLPYKDMHYDFVLMVFCISYFDDLAAAFREARRVLKNDGALIIGFIDKDSIIGKAYEARRAESVFYKQAIFFTPEKVIDELKSLGFRKMEFAQTLFKPLDKIQEFEPSKPGYGEGSFVLIKAIK